MTPTPAMLPDGWSAIVADPVLRLLLFGGRSPGGPDIPGTGVGGATEPGPSSKALRSMTPGRARPHREADDDVAVPERMLVEEFDAGAAHRRLGRFIERHGPTLAAVTGRGRQVDGDDGPHRLDPTIPGLDELMIALAIAETVVDLDGPRLIVDPVPAAEAPRRLTMLEFLGRRRGVLEGLLATLRFVRSMPGVGGTPDARAQHLVPAPRRIETPERLRREPAGSWCAGQAWVEATSLGDCGDLLAVLEVPGLVVPGITLHHVIPPHVVSTMMRADAAESGRRGMERPGSIAPRRVWPMPRIGTAWFGRPSSSASGLEDASPALVPARRDDPAVDLHDGAASGQGTHSRASGRRTVPGWTPPSLPSVQPIDPGGRPAALETPDHRSLEPMPSCSPAPASFIPRVAGTAAAAPPRVAAADASSPRPVETPPPSFAPPAFPSPQAELVTAWTPPRGVLPWTGASGPDVDWSSPPAAPPWTREPPYAPAVAAPTFEPPAMRAEAVPATAPPTEMAERVPPAGELPIAWTPPTLTSPIPPACLVDASSTSRLEGSSPDLVSADFASPDLPSPGPASPGPALPPPPAFPTFAPPACTPDSGPDRPVTESSPSVLAHTAASVRAAGERPGPSLRGERFHWDTPAA